jgi:hypothetical protein
MAVNVDIVYKTVLLILNKEQRGNLSPDEFNKVATQVQLEIFESYFDTLNQQLRRPDNDTEYGDRIKNVDQSIAIFKSYGNCTYVNNGGYFNTPIASGLSNATAQLIGDGRLVSFALTSITSSQLASGTTTVTVNGIYNNSFTINGSSIIFTSPPALNAIILVTTTPNDFYKLGTVIYKDNTEAQLSARNEILYINKTPLLAPTLTYPIYLYENQKIYLYPKTITSDITVSYLRKPLDVIWNFTIPAGANYYQYDSSGSQNFELAKTEQANIILKVLLYSGVVIRDPSIVNIAAQQVQQETQRSTL